MKSSKRLKMNPRCLLLVNENGDFEVFPKEDFTNNSSGCCAKQFSTCLITKEILFFILNRS
jgi:hypothetical protein